MTITRRAAAFAAVFIASAARLTAQGDSARLRHDTLRTLEAVTVTAIRARPNGPVSARVVTAQELERRSFGQDLPLLISGAASLVSYSETGSFWGYSYIRLRGIDQSRINLTLDGIPLNDPEDQVLYFADFPDLANSINSVQIQRGVGTSAPGTASYGGSINFETIPVAATVRSSEVQLQHGAFGSTRASAEYASGLSSSGFAVYGRVSALQSTGYRRHSGTEGRSAFLSAAYVRNRDVFKLTTLVGLFADTLAYVGASKSELAMDRRFNPLRGDEVDRFAEQVVALSYTRFIGTNTTASATAYRISAGGNYDVCVFRCDQPQGDLWNFRLDFAWYGATSAWTWERGRARFDAGLNANTYARDHSAYARPDVTRPLYLNTGHKNDASAFAKIAYDLGALTLFGDVQGRHAQFRYTPDVNAGIAGDALSWDFVNPKVGATLRLSSALQGYASLGVNSREPARSDLFGGLDNVDSSSASLSGSFDRVRPERVRDVETGIRLRSPRWSVEAGAFAMAFRNEILPIGRMTNIGTPLRANVRSSWRRGVEVAVESSPVHRLQVGLSVTAMGARIADYIDEETGIAYHAVEPLLTPRFLASPRLAATLTRSLSLSLHSRFSSRGFLTNTGDATLLLPSYSVTDASLDWTRGSRRLSIYVNNLTNTPAYSGGHVSGGIARYYVLAPVNLFLLARIGL